MFSVKRAPLFMGISLKVCGETFCESYFDYANGNETRRHLSLASRVTHKQNYKEFCWINFPYPLGRGSRLLPTATITLAPFPLLFICKSKEIRHIDSWCIWAWRAVHLFPICKTTFPLFFSPFSGRTRPNKPFFLLYCRVNQFLDADGVVYQNVVIFNKLWGIFKSQFLSVMPHKQKCTFYLSLILMMSLSTLG